MSKLWSPAKSVLEDGVSGVKLEDLSLDTRVTSARFVAPDADPLVPAIYHSSTYKLKSVDDYLRILNKSGYIYGRLGHPNGDAVECAIHALEGGAGSMMFSSGTAAITTAFMCFLKAGDHVISQHPVYSGTHEILDKIMTKFGVEVTWVPVGCPMEEYRKHIKPNTRLIYGETPCNPMMTILDLEAFGKLGESLGDDVITMVDGTFASPYCQQAMKYGIDISMHSCSKYMGGHSDLIAGCLTFKDVKQWRAMKQYQTSIGVQLSPHDASLLLRGLKTLHLRMPRHGSNGQKVAEFLEKHPKVESVVYPGLASHPCHELAKTQMNGYGGMIGVWIKGGLEGGKAFVENVHIAQLAVSLGGIETLVAQPTTMSHGPKKTSGEERSVDGFVRISVGLEDVHDIIKDFSQALDKVEDV